MVAPIRFLSGRQQQQKIGIEGGSDVDKKVLEVVGRVGIGTTIFDADYELDVHGDANISGILTTSQIYADVIVTPTILYSLNDLDITGIATVGEDLYVTGNAGIGSTQPTAKLDVDGTLNVTGIATFGSDLDVNASVDISNNLVVDGLSDLDELNVAGLSTFASDLDINASVDILNDLTVDGLSDLDELNVAGLSTFQDDVNIGVGGTVAFFDVSTGYVGIGTENPGELLDVRGNLRVGNRKTGSLESNYIAFAGVLQDNQSEYNHGFIGVRNHTIGTEDSELFLFKGNDGLGAGSSGVDRVRIGSGEFRVDTYTSSTAGSFDTVAASADFVNRLIVDKYGNIGINSTSPTAKLDVDGTLNVTGVSTFQGNVNLGDNDRLFFGDGQDLEILHDGTNSVINHRAAATGSLFIISKDKLTLQTQDSGGVIKDALIARVDGAVELYYDNSKKFETTGIGVSISNGTSDTATITAPENLIIDPAAVGDNTGVVRIKGDLYVDGTTTQINSTTIELADFIVGIATTATTDLLADGAGIQIGADNTFLYEYNSGTNPSLKSSENLNVASGKVYQIDQTERLSANTLSLGTGTTIHSPADNTLLFGINNTETFRIAADGQIGIGTTNPTQDLDIDGSVRIRDRIYDSNDNAGTLNYVLSSGGPGSPWSWQSVISVGATDSVNIQDISDDQIQYILFSPTVGDVTGLAVTTQGLVFNPSSRYIGIGSTTPTANLDVDGDVNVSGIITTNQLSVSGISTDGVEFGNINYVIVADGSGAWSWKSVLATGAGTLSSIVILDEGALVSTSGTVTQIDFKGNNISAIGEDGSGIATVTFSDTPTFTSLNVSGVSTLTGPVTIGNTMSFGDNDRLRFGDGNDLQIYHLSNTSFIRDTGAGNLNIDSDNGSINIRVNSNESAVVANQDGSVELYYDNSKKFETAGIGITVFGNTETQTLNVTGVSTFASDLDINASVDILTDLTVNGNLEVDGHADLDDLTVTGVTTTGTLYIGAAGTVGITTILDEDDMVSNSDTALATQQSIKTYVDNTVNANNQLNFTDGTTNGSIDLNIESLSVLGTNNEVTVEVTSEGAGVGNTITIGIPDDVIVTTSLTVGTATTLTNDGITATNITGTLNNTLTLETSGTGLSGSATYNNSGSSTFTVTSNATPNNTPSTIVSRDGSGNFSASTITADLTGVASTATKLQNARDFSITGSFVTAPAISFDGTGNVALAATITPDSIGLGTYTSGDYVKSITGTVGEIDVSVTSGEGVTPQIGLPNNVTIGNNLTVTNDLLVQNDLFVDGSITIGGTSATLFTQTLEVEDANIILGINTDSGGNILSNDTTATSGGIAIASTEGTPIIDLTVSGIDTISSTYKKLLWFEQGSFAGLGTDVWMFNYGVGIGSTQIPFGTRLAVGNVQVTDNEIDLQSITIRDKIYDSSDSAGATDYVLTSGGSSGTWSWQPVSAVGGAQINVNDEGTLLGAYPTLNFVGSNITATGAGNTATITLSESPTFDDVTATNVNVTGLTTTNNLRVSGVSTFQSDVNVDNGLLYVDSVINRIGIGTTAPSTAGVYIADIRGPILIGPTPVSQLSVGSGDIIRQNGHLNIYGGGTGASEVNIRNNSNIRLKPHVGGVELYYGKTDKKFETTGYGVTVSGGLTVSGVSTFQDDINVGSGGTTAFFDISSGRVGINSTTPLQLLDVFGSIRIAERIYDSTNSPGGANAVLTSGGPGGTWAWQLVSAIGGAQIDVYDEDILEGTFAAIKFSSINLDVTSGVGSTATVTLTSTPTFTDLNITGVSTIPVISGLTTFQDNVEFKGNVDLADQDRLRFGNGQDLQIYHDGNNSYIQDTGTGNLYIDSSNLFIRNAGGDEYVQVTGTGDVGIGSTSPTAKLDVAGTSKFNGNATFTDNSRIFVGTGQDLEIYHDTTNTYIQEKGTGNLIITANGAIDLQEYGTGNKMALFNGSGSVELYHNDSKKFETIGTGVSITGNVDIDDTTVIGSATASLSTLTQTAIHTELAIATYRSVEYTIQATQGTNFHATKILALHNGTTAYHNEYGTIFNNSSVASFDVDISGGNLRLLATSASASQTDYVVNFVAIKV